MGACKQEFSSVYNHEQTTPDIIYPEHQTTTPTSSSVEQDLTSTLIELTAQQRATNSTLESDFLSTTPLPEAGGPSNARSPISGLGIFLPENPESSHSELADPSGEALSLLWPEFYSDLQDLPFTLESVSSDPNMGLALTSSDGMISSVPLVDSPQHLDSKDACEYLRWPSPDLFAACPPSPSVEDFLVSCGLLTKPDLSILGDHLALCLSSNSPKMSLLATDANLFEAMSAEGLSDVGVDPRDILPNEPIPPEDQEDVVGSLSSLSPEDTIPAPPSAVEPSDQPGDETTLTFPRISEGERFHPLSLSCATATLEDPLAVPQLNPYLPYPPLDLHAISPILSFYPAPLDNLCVPQTTSVTAIRQKPFARRSSASHNTHLGEDSLSYAFVQTPVLNAHQGIHLEDLLLRAAKYRARNPGEPLSQQWLLAYAGQLSQEGEQLGEWRCYVIGCSQTNKRRDHILTHVGSHVDERPYRCEYCSMRFLRSNEHRRHLTAHSGQKPWVCDMCTSGDRAFARQDLLKRHLKRAHGIGAGNEHRPAKKAKKA